MESEPHITSTSLLFVLLTEFAVSGQYHRIVMKVRMRVIVVRQRNGNVEHLALLNKTNPRRLSPKRKRILYYDRTLSTLGIEF
jgi:hypothetical protein